MVMSLDGYIAGPDGALDFEIRDEEIGRFLISDLLQTVDTMIMGRVLYEGFAQAWPAMANDPKSPKDLVDFAHWIEDSPKAVLSQTLEEATWKNSKILKAHSDSEVIAEVNKLKQLPGKDIVLFGGVRTAQTLVRLGLVDEYRFKIQPITLGAGLPLFTTISQRMNLDLTYSHVFDSGVVALYYKPKA